MRYLVDGHNLIPQMDGLSLSELDDEAKLIQRLAEFARNKRAAVDVYFDKAPAGYARTIRTGKVKATFIQASSSADDAIIEVVRRLGKQASACTVVTSDRRIQNEVRRSGCKIMGSQSFASLVRETMISSREGSSKDAGISESEVQDWLTEFDNSRHPKI